MESNRIPLNVTLTEPSSCFMSMTVTVPAASARKVYNEELKELVRHAKLPGFRPGKIPPRMLMQHFGKGLIAGVSERLVNEGVRQALTEQDLDPAESPRPTAAGLPDYVVDQDYTFTVEFEHYPKFALVPYRGLKVTRESTEVSESEIDEAIKNWLEQQSTFKAVERPSARNDMLKVKFSSEPVEGLEADKRFGYLLSAESSWIMLREPEMLPGCQTFLLDLKAGDSKDCEVLFPDDFRIEELRGKTLNYHFEVLEVEGQVVPELDEEMFKKFNVASLEEFRKFVADQIKGGKENSQNRQITEQVFKLLADSYDFPLPPKTLERAAQGQIERFKETAQHSEHDEEKRQKMIDDFVAGAAQEVADQLRIERVLERVIAAEKITLNSQDLHAELAAIAQSERITIEALINRLRNTHGAFESFSSGILRRKALKLLVDAAEVTVTEPVEAAKA